MIRSLLPPSSLTMTAITLLCLGVALPATGAAAAAEPKSQITILYDAFGTDAAMKKDWGFSALVEVAGKRILFDTGNDRNIFAANDGPEMKSAIRYDKQCTTIGREPSERRFRCLD